MYLQLPVFEGQNPVLVAFIQIPVSVNLVNHLIGLLCRANRFFKDDDVGQVSLEVNKAFASKVRWVDSEEIDDPLAFAEKLALAPFPDSNDNIVYASKMVLCCTAHTVPVLLGRLGVTPETSSTTHTDYKTSPISLPFLQELSALAINELAPIF